MYPSGKAHKGMNSCSLKTFPSLTLQSALVVLFVNILHYVITELSVTLRDDHLESMSAGV